MVLARAVACFTTTEFLQPWLSQDKGFVFRVVPGCVLFEAGPVWIWRCSWMSLVTLLRRWSHTGSLGPRVLGS